MIWLGKAMACHGKDKACQGQGLAWHGMARTRHGLGRQGHGMPRTRLGITTKDLKTLYGEQRLAVWSMKVLQKEVHWGHTHQNS